MSTTGSANSNTSTAGASAGPSTNRAGLDKKAYSGSESTLCTGCGHDLITNHIISACYQSDLPPHRVAKMSGIGCSSKIPAYFMSGSFAFNSMHGRMAPVSTGAITVQPQLKYLGVSGDGDTASIGVGGFIHLIRRNLPICYIIADNGVYGLTKGQFSATAEAESVLKTGERNLFESIDVCSLALDVGCGFVARSFSGDGKQLVPLIQAALRHRGTAVIDVISPCIAFNNHEGSTKSYPYVKAHDVSLQELGFIAAQDHQEVDYAEGATQTIAMGDGSELILRKLDPRAHDVTNKVAAMNLMAQAREKKELLTGLFYVNENEPTLIERISLCDQALSQLQEKDLRISKSQFSELVREFC